MSGKSLAYTIALIALHHMALAQSLPRYTGTVLSDATRHDGALVPVVGVHNIQIMRANREHPTAANGNGWTYNHQPMMAYCYGRYWVHYLSDPSDEHVPPSETRLQSSMDGYSWSDPVVLFPQYVVPEWYTKPGREDRSDGTLVAIMHQRMGWYVSSEGRLYALANYGVAFDKKDDPNDGNGIGRVMREVHADGTLGTIHFIYYNHGFTEQNTAFPHWRKGDKHLRKAAQEILSNPRYRMQWVEEADRNDPLIPLNKVYKAYCDYTLPDGSIVALWKHALTSRSTDGGLTWQQPVNRAQGFVNSNAKIWGQRLSDGSYATAYNPSEYRWPLALSWSKDGLNYSTLNLLCGEVPPMRYGGNYKSYGPQYVRGIQEGNGTPPDGDMWLSYSMNKEDIWVVDVPVPVRNHATEHANDHFDRYHSLEQLRQWNIYSPLMARVELSDGWLVMHDSDPHDYARVDRMIPSAKELEVSFDVKAMQSHHGLLQVEFQNAQGQAASRMELTSDGIIRAKGGARYGRLTSYNAGQIYHITVRLSTQHRLAEYFIDGRKAGQRMLFSPVQAFERIMFRTGEQRYYPTVDTPADWDGVLPDAGETDNEALFCINNVTTRSLDADEGSAVLSSNSYRHYVDYFNSMEQEDIRQAIPNDSAWQWMEQNVPLFDAPDKQMEQMWYFRWWTLRKHIKQTPVGYAMTEFLVPRSYADKYNLIASAVGHHLHESRWLRDTTYVDQIVRTWYTGNDGKPMEKLNFYSSWLPQSIYDRFLVDGRRSWVTSLLPQMVAEYDVWNDHRWGDEAQTAAGLYWQYDVRDAMEETISGGRKEKNARPSINSYMYGNARAIAAVARLAADDAVERRFSLKADTLRRLTEDCLWNDTARFFQVRYPSLAWSGVREEIGFLPWYFNLPADNATYATAWRELTDTKGFCAPRGITTAEQRHPAFRTHGQGHCEWDGAVWPYATAQTLTALANFINDYPTGATSLYGDTAQQTLRRIYMQEMVKYTQSQSHRGMPYIGEYHDETTGYWLKGDQQRSKYYNHSTYNDLVITGICGLRPRSDNRVVVNPLLPEGAWSYFCVDNIAYHGHRLTIVWDADGSRYNVGRGLQVMVDGKQMAHRDTLGQLECELR